MRSQVVIGLLFLLCAPLLLGCSGPSASVASQAATAVPPVAQQATTAPPLPQQPSTGAAPASAQPPTATPRAAISAASRASVAVTPLPTPLRTTPLEVPSAFTPIPESSLQQLSPDERTVAEIFPRAGPAVVRIETDQGLGSGFLIDQDGNIITNNHVVEGSQNGLVLVSFTGLFQTTGQIIGTDPDSDIAVVRASHLPANTSPIELGDSSAVIVGQRVIAIGNPLGQDRTVTTGIISAIGRTVDEPQSSYRIGGAIQTDAAINPGNSGGPLLDTSGKVIGMNTLILSSSGTSSGIGFAVPANLIKKVATALLRNGRYLHPYLGAGFTNVTTLQAQQQSLPSAGVLLSPAADGPVNRAGISGPVMLTAINGMPVSSSDEMIAYLELTTSPGDTVTLTVIGGDGRAQQVPVRLGARPEAAQ